MANAKAENTDLVEVNRESVLKKYSSENGLDDIIGNVKSLVSSFEHDMSTGVSRARTASLAAKVSSFKVRIDGMGKELTAEWAKKKKAVDVNRKTVRDELDKIRDEARKPLNDWEDEQARIEAEKQAQREAEALALKVESDHELALLLNNEIDRKADEKLKAEEAERVAAENQARIDREERERIIASEARAKAEAEKLQAEQREAAAIAQAETQKRLAEEAQKKAEEDRIEAARIAKERAEMAAKEAAENERARAEKEAEAIRLEAEARASDKANRKAINSQIFRTINDLDINIEPQKIVDLIMAISEGKIDNLKINY